MSSQKPLKKSFANMVDTYSRLPPASRYGYLVGVVTDLLSQNPQDRIFGRFQAQACLRVEEVEREMREAADADA